jgi:hypothetical protein
MHGAAAGLVGAAVGRFRFRRGASRGFASLSGWIAAMLLHALFNGISQSYSISDRLVTPLLVGVGLLGVGMIGFFITRGLREQGEWLLETLDRQVVMSGAEARAAKAYGSLDVVLEPLASQFPEVAEQIEELVLKQAQLGILRKKYQEVDDAKLKERWSEEMATMQVEMEELRNEIGWYRMAFVKIVFPEDKFDVWGKLEKLVVGDGTADVTQFASKLSGSEEKPEQAFKDAPPQRSIFGSLQEPPEKS